MILRIFLMTVFICFFVKAEEKLNSIEWKTPEGWEQVELKQKHFPYVFVGPDKLRISLLRHQYRPDGIWVISKIYRTKLGLPLLTEEELAAKRTPLSNDSVYFEFSKDDKAISYSFYRSHGYLWVLKFEGDSKNLLTIRKVLKTLSKSLKPSSAFQQYVKDLQQNEGDPQKSLKLSELYDKGLGVPQDQKKAFEMLVKLHKEGNLEATYRLGSKHLSINNISQAFTLLKDAADGGHLASIKKLAALYIDYKQDTLEGFILLKKAAERGDTESMFYLGTLYTVDPKLKDEKEAFKWTSTAAQKGWLPAVRQLGVLYRSGFGVDKNIELALQNLESAANQGDQSANEILADMYRNGEVDGRKDFEKSRVYMMKAALSGSKKAMLMTAEIYLKGEGVAKDIDKALNLLVQASEKGLVEADLLLGDIYTLGKDVTADFEKAFHYYKKAAEAGNKYGMFKLALAYLSGKGCKKDGPTAVNWLKRSAKLGYAPAIKALKDTGF